jgi:hypothetical protein
MKYLALLALVAVTFSFGACAHKADTSTTTTSSAHTGYSK